jgi:predicted O-linked N-acetylglucosamine transferase (SPINDLY family)
MTEQPDSETRASVATNLNHALAAHQAGNLSDAEHFYNLVLANDKKQFDALHMLAILNAQRGNFKVAARRFREASEVKPDHAPCHYNHGNVLIELKQFAQAIVCYDRALAIAPGYIEAHFNRGNALLRFGRFVDALADFDSAVRLNPNIAEIHSSRGNALRELKRLDDALASFDRALLLRPNEAAFHANRGNVLHELGRFDEAIGSFDKALTRRPNDAEFHYNRGNILCEIGRLEDGLASFDKAVALLPGEAEFHQNRGNVLLDLGRFSEAFADYDKAWALNPALKYLEGARFYAKTHLCDWSNLADDGAAVLAHVRAGATASLPFPVLAMDSTPADQLTCAEIYAADRYPAAAPADQRSQSRHSHDRVRIAYLSADFHNHATAQLTAGMFEHHDRSRFEISAISFGPDDRSAMRGRLLKAFDRFVDVQTKSTNEIAGLVRAMEIDIVIDLGGYTQRSRTGIVALRPAPLQVNYLGYAGTMGAPFIDYIIADKILIPGDQQRYYAEKIVYLPHSYQANDDKRRVSDLIVTRTAAGLPERGLVFCSFNNSYKITPDMFSVWMRLLHQVNGSVLWLLEGNATAPDNLRAEAAKRGVSPERLIFAPKMSIEIHLARHGLADLFLDTLPYNAHTTASDALWAGVPVVTCLGSTFAGRVAASILMAAGLPELVTESLENYEALALRLAREPSLLAAMKSKVASNRGKCPLFDTASFTRHIEAAYSKIWQRHQSGEPPANYTIEP